MTFYYVTYTIKKLDAEGSMTMSIVHFPTTRDGWLEFMDRLRESALTLSLDKMMKPPLGYVKNPSHVMITNIINLSKL